MLSFIYNRLLLPLAEMVFRLASAWSAKARAAVKGRSDWETKLSGQLEDAPRGDRLLFHAPSVGEFLQGRAVLDVILDRYPDRVAVVTHFSPSAEKIVTAYKKAAAHGYLPLDTRRNVRRLLELVDPRFIAFARADVWPNLAQEASNRGVPAVLIAGGLSEMSGHLNQTSIRFAGRRFRNLKFVGAISEEDKSRFVSIGVSPSIIEVTGDPRYDQTWERARQVEPADPQFAQFPKDGWTLVAGSTWPQDEKALLPAFASVRDSRPDARLIIAPHEPLPERIKSIRKALQGMGIESATLSEIESAKKSNAAFGGAAIIVDRVGILAKLYHLGKAAFVGGSFVRRVHNVMEPACFEIPVIVGPRHANSHEAVMMIRAGGCIKVDGAKALADVWLKMIGDEGFRANAGKAAMELVVSQRGAAIRTLEALQKRFPELFPAGGVKPTPD